MLVCYLLFAGSGVCLVVGCLFIGCCFVVLFLGCLRFGLLLVACLFDVLTFIWFLYLSCC